MNVKYIILSVLLVSQTMMAQTDSCHIQFKVDGMKEGKVKIIGVFADQNYIADSTLITGNEGRFEIKRLHPLKPGYFYVILPDFTNFHMIIDKDQHFSMTTSTKDLIFNMHIKGSRDNELLYQSLTLQLRHEEIQDSCKKVLEQHPNNEGISKSIDSVYNNLNTAWKLHLSDLAKHDPNLFFTKYKLAGQNPDASAYKKAKNDEEKNQQLEQFRSAFWDNVDLNDARLLYTPVIVNKLKRFITELTPQHPDSIIRQADIIIKKSMVNKEMFQFISSWIVLKYQPTKTAVMGGESVFVHIINTYFTKELAYWYNEKDLADIRKKAWEMEASLLFKIGPDVISTDPNGNKKSIYELQSDYTIVFMYDTKCEHCQAETPLLREFYKKWKSKGVEVYAIAINAKDDEWKKFISDYQIHDWINVSDPTNRSIYAKYFVDITPELYVLNKDHKIIGKNLKVEQIPMVIEMDKTKKQ
ncbi:MAG: redoxin domain-containing protein [Saprospiraceae bacterium]|uniref:Redoxin domain-containing protein n=1 Tax=Candidatus Defluviibacterium haderslevense TaxID=2981993 RepID=A0A9D7SB02_9BACT|nr:redoxin domain-containing protein [Candidatus Defluviibacterium haderslevense]